MTVGMKSRELTIHSPTLAAHVEGTRLSLPQVTLCAVTSVNVKATLQALHKCLDQVSFGGCKLLTDARVTSSHPEISVEPISRLESSRDYSNFMLRNLADHVDTSHCLVVQWDGYLLDARQWQPEFLQYDYIGATWPQFNDGHDVGNGGFSLRSRKLIEACRHPSFAGDHPEDVAIGRTNRHWLESQGLTFAPRHLADAFAAERTGRIGAAFGFHGIFNMPTAIGVDAFWEVYRGLDDRSTLANDFGSILKDVRGGSQPVSRSARMVIDRVVEPLQRKVRR